MLSGSNTANVGQRPLHSKSWATGISAALLFSAVVCLGGGIPASQTVIRMRLLDATSGVPLKDTRVALAMFAENRTGKGMRNATTDSNGVAAFELPNEVPDRIGPRFGPDYVGNCSEVEFSTAEVLKNGVVGKIYDYCGPSKLRDSVTAKPGELVIFAKPVSPWVRFLRELF